MVFKFWKSKAPSNIFRYTCAECGEIHKGPPSFSIRHPPGYDAALAGEDGAKVIMDTSDWFVVGYEGGHVDYFIRATLEIPINPTDDVFTWGLWVTQSKESFERYHNTFGEDQSGEGSFGWLFGDFAPYSPQGHEMAHLACDVEWQSNGRRPLLFLHNGDHPLIQDQQNGISTKRAIDIATMLTHA